MKKRFLLSSLLCLLTAQVSWGEPGLLLPKLSVYEVSDYGIYPDGSDVGESLHTLITNVQQSGGGTIQFQSGTYYSSRQVGFFTSGSPPNQPNLWIRGTAPHASYSANSRPTSGTILLLNSTNSLAHITTRGFGTLKLTDITLKATNRTFIPFIKSIYTTLKIRDVMFYGSDQNPNCFEDGIVLGGDGPPDFVTGGDNASFQGYGTVIQDCYFNRIRVPIRLAAHANATWFVDNVIMNECGGKNNPWGAAQVLDALGWGSITGNKLDGTLIEMTGFSRGTYFGGGAAMNSVINNTHYDAKPELNPVAYYFQDSGSGNKVESGQVTVNMKLKGGNSLVNQEVRTSIPGLTNDYYNVSHHHGVTRYIGHAAMPQYSAGGSTIFYSLTDNGMLWYLNGLPTMRMGRDPVTNHWLGLYGSGTFSASDNAYFLSGIGRETILGDHQMQFVRIRNGVLSTGDIISWGTNTSNADISTEPQDAVTVVGWLPLTNNGVRFLQPLYR